MKLPYKFAHSLGKPIITDHSSEVKASLAPGDYVKVIRPAPGHEWHDEYKQHVGKIYKITSLNGLHVYLDNSDLYYGIHDLEKIEPIEKAAEPKTSQTDFPEKCKSLYQSLKKLKGHNNHLYNWFRVANYSSLAYANKILSTIDQEKMPSGTWQFATCKSKSGKGLIMARRIT